jgi:transcriptional regulator with XRE-family HTH domain
MSNTEQMRDDLDAYIATFDEEERRELAHAEAALDLAALLYQARKARGWTQKIAAKLSGVRQQAISRWERSHANMQIDTLRTYLEALGYNLELVIKDAETGEIVATTELPDASHPVEAEAAVTEQWGEPLTLPERPVRTARYRLGSWWPDDLGTTPVMIWSEQHASGDWQAYARTFYKELYRLSDQRLYAAANQSGVAHMLLTDENNGYGYAFGGWQNAPASFSEAQPYQAEKIRQVHTLNDLTINQQPALVSPLQQVGA